MCLPLSLVPVQAVVACLVAACIRMAHVLAVAVLVELVFAILGMQLFQGEMHSCTSGTCCTDATDPGSCTVGAAVVDDERLSNDWDTPTVCLAGCCMLFALRCRAWFIAATGAWDPMMLACRARRADRHL
jgi:hypothetical protein